jgi:acetoin utilization protein AcuB
MYFRWPISRIARDRFAPKALQSPRQRCAAKRRSTAMNARDVMTEAPTSIRASAPIREALVVLQSLEVRELPVVDWRGSLVGVVSDRELGSLCLSRMLDGAPGTWLDQDVASVMSGVAPTVGPEADVWELVRLMVDKKLGAVPVVRPDGALIGMVSYLDLLRELRDPTAGRGLDRQMLSPGVARGVPLGAPSGNSGNGRNEG